MESSDSLQNAQEYKAETKIFISSNDEGGKTDKVNLKSNSNLQTKELTGKSIVTLHAIETVDSSKDNDGIDDNIVILRKDPKTQRNQINKTAYAKLHRTLSASRNSNSVDTLKEKYEGNAKPDLINVKAEKNDESEETSELTNEETVGALKTKYSPASFGYPKPMSKNSKIPTPKPRNAVKSQIIVPSNKPNESHRVRYSLDVEKKSKSKDENSNELFRRNSSSSGEFISIVTRSDSEASVDKFEKELNLFTMENKPKEKKRSSSFRKIFSGRIFSKDKKKKEDEMNKLQYKENMARSENLENETNVFHRQAQYRHTTGGSSGINTKNKLARTQSDRSTPQQVHITKEMEERYAQRHVNQFNSIVQNFEHPQQPTKKPVSEGYVPMDKPIVKNTAGPTNYMNMPNIKKYIDTSSSASTLESEKSNFYQNEGSSKHLSSDDKTVAFIENNRDLSKNTPPRAQELRQDVRLVNPKALIPINTERPLPNPYQNTNERPAMDKPKIYPKPTVTKATRTGGTNQPRFEETYGTVFDSLRSNHAGHRPPTNELKTFQKPPRSPSFEPTKLKLPPNREIVPLSPRVKSPIPSDNISTEKIIATELLKPNKSPVTVRKIGTRLSSPSHQKLEIDIDYPDYVNNVARNENEENNMPFSSKPPISKIYSRKDTSNYNGNNTAIRTLSPPNQLTFENSRLSQNSPVENIYFIRKNLPSSSADQDPISPNINIQTHSPRARTPTPNNVLVNRSLSPLRPQSVRSSTPVDTRMSPSINTSPQKDDMRKSVEAYYWKELKRLKEQENYDLYLYQMQMMPYGYAEEPISVRRSRSLSPTSQKSSRRSLSLPRDLRPPAREIPSNYYRVQTDSIPEGRAVINAQIPQRNIIYGQLQYQPTLRPVPTPDSRPSDNSGRSSESYSLSRPIFKRGSLSTPIRGDVNEDPQNKKVSFSNSRPSDTQSLQAWPTKNGFTQSPPQRRINNRNSALEDDVFLPNVTQLPNNYDYSTKQPPNLRYEFQPKPNEIDFSGPRYNVPRQNLQQTYDPYQNSRQRSSQSQGYAPLQEESMYGQPVDAVRPPYVLTRHGSIQLQEPLYGQRQNVARRMSYDNSQIDRRQTESPYINQQQYVSYNQVADPVYGLQRREIIMKDEIFGQFGGYLPQGNNNQLYDIQQRQPQIQSPVYSSRQSVSEPLYGPKQVSVRNKVCDIYGQIHDRDSPAPNQINSGVIMGQLQQRNPGSPQVIRQSHSHLPGEQFARNTRLTASANDMYRRYQNTDPRLQRSDAPYRGVGPTPGQDMGAPNRPLPPVPVDRKKTLHNSSGKSDTESASDASEMQKFRNNAKNKKRSLFGK